MDDDKLTPKIDFQVELGMIIMLVLVATITFFTIKQPSQIIYNPKTIPNPSPLGYTFSLVMFIVPALVIKWWFLKNPQYKVEKKAYWTTILILTPIGFLLDMFFGNSFFSFDNKAATMGIDLFGYVFGQGWGRNIPIEEFIFYFTGFLSLLLIYVWGDMYWFGAYNVDDYPRATQRLDKIISFHFPTLLVCLGLVAFAFIYKNYFARPPYLGGIPGYFLFLIGVLVPTIFLIKATLHFVNWRALSFSLFFLLFLSLLWEGTLGVPYAWWGYRPEQMMGIIMLPMASLPLEAVSVWFLTTWTTIIFYEVTKIYLYMGRPFKQAMLGGSAS